MAGMELIGAAATIEAIDDLRGFAQPAEYIVGTDVEYAIHLEFGTSKMDSYPIFRPAVKEFEADPNGFLAKNGQDTDIESTQEAVKKVAFALERQVKKNAAAAQESGRSPGTDPNHPEVQTGNLRGGIQAQRVR